MPSRFLALFLMVMSAAGLSSAQAPANTQALDIYFIDTEGGQATLYVSPSGQTLLVDTGNAGERDLGRILGVLELAGVKQIDHLFLTHYHGDHYGSMPELAKRIPIKHFYDHGESVELDRPNIAAFAKVYAELVGKTAHTVVKPGDKIALAGTDITVVTSAGNVLQTPIAKAPGAGRPNPACASFKERDETRVDPDNHQSAGFVLTYGRFRMLNLGDFTWNREFKLMCPNNPIGTVDLYLTSHHGLDQSGSAALVHGVRPARGDHEQRHAQRGGCPDGGDSRIVAWPRRSLAAALVVLGRHRAQRARRDDREYRRPRAARGNPHQPGARRATGRRTAAGGSRRECGPHARALPQSVGADGRLVPGHEQPQQVHEDLRREELRPGLNERSPSGLPSLKGAVMKLWLISALVLTIGVLAGAQSSSSGGVHVDPAKVAAALAKGGPLVTRPDLLVSGSHRETGGKGRSARQGDRCPLRRRRRGDIRVWRQDGGR
jgi:beta-lactamase superfamily II metal-dependent hydrolase